MDLFAPWPRILDPRPASPPIAPKDAATAALSLRDVEVRDGLVAWLSPGTLNILSPEVHDLFAGLHRPCDEEARGASAAAAKNRAQARLIQLCAMPPDEGAAPALSVLASFA